ncbi:MAG TPA: alpha-N-arabinofuranosidase [Verrucomicrobiae bacterium]
MKTIYSLLLWLLLAVAATAQAAVNETVTATVDASKCGAPISPLLYGQFIEHAGNIIYSGLWSEMLDDRKFYFAVQPKPADDANPSPVGFNGRRRGVGPGRWNPVGPATGVVMDTNRVFVGDHSPLITLAGNEPRGISQAGVNFIKGKTYNGRLQLAGDAAARVFVSIVWDTNAVKNHVSAVAPIEGKLAENYQQFLFSLTANESGPARFEIVGTGSGSFRVGAVSLMPAENLDGFRPDSIAALKSLRSGVYRFPGGNFVSAHEWRNAIGQPDKRPQTWDPVWRALQPNDIGTDEFMKLCQLLDVEPYITVNAGTGDAWSAAEYVEYCNGAASTPMGRQRAANGHPEPYRVKFWGIGNEMWGISYQYGAMKPNQFAFKHNEFARAMRKVDPTITLIASGAMPDTMTGSKESLSLGTNLVPPYLSPGDWSGMLFSNCFDNFQLMSDHYYNFGTTHFSLAEGRQVANDPSEPVTDWMRRPANHIRIKYEEYCDYERIFPELAAHPKPLNIDEWGYMGGKYPVYPAFAWAFHEMFRHSDLFQMAAFTFATSLLSHDGLTNSLNNNALVFKIYRDHFGAIPVAVTGNSPQPPPAGPPGGEQPKVNAGSDTFPLDIAAAWTENRRALTVAVLNPTDIEQQTRLKITGANLSGKGTLWQLGAADAADENARDLRITSSSLSAVPDLLTLPRFSVNIYELEVTQ